jgi:hypothetical protein
LISIREPEGTGIIARRIDRLYPAAPQSGHARRESEVLKALG